MIIAWLRAVFDDRIDLGLVAFGLGFGLLGIWIADTRHRNRERRAICQALSDERRRLAGALHDILGHGLVAVAMHARRLRGVSPEARGIAETIDEIVHFTSRQMRELVGTLRRDPGSTEFCSELIEMASRLPMGRLSLVLDGAECAEKVPDELRTTVLRIVQEGLTNAVKHSAGAPVRIQVAFAGPLTVTVASGHGGRAAQVPGQASPVELAQRGYGLDGLRLRVHEQGGYFESGRTPEGGFVMSARFPSAAGALLSGAT